MEGNFQLNINIEGDIADLHCLFRYFKNILPFQLTLISVNKDIFLCSCYRTEKKLLLSEKDIYFTDGIVLLVRFYEIIMSYTSQQLQCDIRVQQLCL